MADINQNVKIRIFQEGAEDVGRKIAGVAKEQNRLMGFVREQRTEQRMQSFLFREAAGAALVFSNALGTTSKEARQLSNSLNAGFAAFQGIDFMLARMPGPLAIIAAALGGVAAAFAAFSSNTEDATDKLSRFKTIADQFTTEGKVELGARIAGKIEEIQARMQASFRGKRDTNLPGLTGIPGIGPSPDKEGYEFRKEMQQRIDDLRAFAEALGVDIEKALKFKKIMDDIATGGLPRVKVGAGRGAGGAGGADGADSWRYPDNFIGPVDWLGNYGVQRMNPQDQRRGAQAGVGEGSAGAMMGQTIDKINQEFALLNDMGMALGDTLRYSLGSAFEDVFGEANSLLEQFAARMLELLARQAVGGLLSLIPGVGPVVGAVVSGGYGLAMAETSGIQAAERRMSSGPGMRLIQTRNEKQRARFAV